MCIDHFWRHIIYCSSGFAKLLKKTTFSVFLSFFLVELSKSQSLKLNISRTACSILMILVSFCRILNGLSDEINLFWRCSSPLSCFETRYRLLCRWYLLHSSLDLVSRQHKLHNIYFRNGVLRRISCHGRNYLQPYFFKRNQSSDNRSHGFGAKFLLKKLSASDFSYERKSAFSPFRFPRLWRSLPALWWEMCHVLIPLFLFLLGLFAKPLHIILTPDEASKVSNSLYFLCIHTFPRSKVWVIESNWERQRNQRCRNFKHKSRFKEALTVHTGLNSIRRSRCRGHAPKPLQCLWSVL